MCQYSPKKSCFRQIQYFRFFALIILPFKKLINLIIFAFVTLMPILFMDAFLFCTKHTSIFKYFMGAINILP